MPEPTNVLFIFCDQLRWDCLGAAGNPVIQTPHLDRLCARGVRFTHAYSTAPLCVPARAQVITGQPPWATGVWGLSDRVLPTHPTFIQTLSDAGYFTGAVGKMHFRPTGGGGSLREPHGLQQMVLSEESVPTYDLSDLEDDYRRYLIEQGYAHLQYTHGRRSPAYSREGYQAQVSELPLEHFDTTWTGRETLRMLEEHGNQPFFIWSSFVKPHFPCELPSDWPCPYRPEDIPLRGSYTATPDIDGETFTFMREAARAATSSGWLEESTLRNFAAYYYGNVTLIDQQVGAMLDLLDERGLSDNTLVVFSSDHGECMGERGQMGKATFHDDSCRVPMIVAGPQVQDPGRVDSRAVTLDDLCPTFLDLVGAPPPELALGESVLPLLTDAGRPGRQAVYGLLGGAYHFETDHIHCFVQRDGWKYMYQFRGAAEKLFHMDTDPLEMTDLAPQELQRCAQMRTALARWLQEHGGGSLTRDGGLRRDLKVG
jgi:arylsulfatase